MVFLDTPRRRYTANRGWAVAAILLWAAALAMAAFYLWDLRGADPADAQQTTDLRALDAAALQSSTTLAVPISTTTTTIPTTTTSTTEAPTTTTTTQAPALTVAASGDVLGDRGVGLFIDENGGEAVFEKVRPLLEPAQLAFVNLEGPISDKGSRATWKEYTFRARPALAPGLLSAGIDVVSMANNHSVDYGTKALLDTIVRLDEAGVCHAGAGADAAAASAPAVLITPAGMVAVLAFTDIIPGGFTATKDSPGVNATTPDRKKILAAIAKAEEKYDFVIVSFHWGTEYAGNAGEDQRKLAHQCVDAGADLVLGHHPHVLQGLEIYKDRLIAYSLGDFVWDHYSQQTGETVILQLTIPKQGPPSAEIVPIYLSEVTGVPAPVTGDHAKSILTRLAELSATLGLELTIAGDRASFGTAPAAAEGAAATSTGTTATSAP